MGLKRYDTPAPLVDVEITANKLKVMLAQGIGAPTSAVVKKGDSVKAGDLIGAYSKDKLGVAVHAPMDGTVTEISDTYVIIER